MTQLKVHVILFLGILTFSESETEYLQSTYVFKSTHLLKYLFSFYWLENIVLYFTF